MISNRCPTTIYTEFLRIIRIIALTRQKVMSCVQKSHLKNCFLLLFLCRPVEIACPTGPIPFRTSKKFLFTCPGTSSNKFTILYFIYGNYYELTCCVENRVDPD